MKNSKKFYDVLVTAHQLAIGEPQLPRYKGIEDHQQELILVAIPIAFLPHDYHHLYFKACKLLLRELADRFDQQELSPSILGLETLLVKVADGQT